MALGCQAHEYWAYGVDIPACDHFDRCSLSDSVTINLNDTDKKRAKQIANYPWFAKKKAWQKEIKQMLDNGFKLEVEALISRDVSYVTEEYAPARLRGRDWLD